MGQATSLSLSLSLYPLPTRTILKLRHTTIHNGLALSIAYTTSYLMCWRQYQLWMLLADTHWGSGHPLLMPTSVQHCFQCVGQELEAGMRYRLGQDMPTHQHNAAAGAASSPWAGPHDFVAAHPWTKYNQEVGRILSTPILALHHGLSLLLESSKSAFHNHVAAAEDLIKEFISVGQKCSVRFRQPNFIRSI